MISKRIWIYFLLGAFLLPLNWSSSAAQGVSSMGNMAARRAGFSMKRWMRYEFNQSKSFSYGDSQIKEGYKVIGYEPSWLIRDSLYLTYPFQLLSDLVIGEYDVNPESGFPRSDSAHVAFRDKDIVQLAAAVNSQLNVLLAVTDYGDYSLYRREFLTEASKKNLLNTLDGLLGEINLYMGHSDGREKVGVLMDFPTVPWNLRREYLEFLRRLKKTLNDEEMGKSCLLYVVLPADDIDQMYTDSIFTMRMREVSDAFIVRMHSFTDSMGPGLKGPMLPMKMDGHISVDSSVRYYTGPARIPASELILEFPYYGRFAVGPNSLSPQRPLVPMAEIFNSVDAPTKMDTLSFCYRKEVDTTTYYFEDTLSLDLKYDWLQQEGLGGIGLYGLGYGTGMDDTEMEARMWQVVAEHFAEPAPRMLFPALSYLLFFICIGVVSSVVWHWQVRYALRETKKSFWYYFGLMCCLILAIVLCAFPLEQVSVTWKIIALVIVLIFPLGRKALKLASKARR